MSEPVRIVVVLEGGLVQGVYTAGVPVEYAVIDYDAQGAHETEIDRIPQGPGVGADTAEAVVFIGTAGPANPWITEHLWPLISPVAPGEFNRAKLAGYTVRLEGGQWSAHDPEGADVYPHLYGSERAAWEACDRHRMFGEG